MIRQTQFLSFDNNCAKKFNEKFLISCPLVHACVTIIITLLIDDKGIFAHIVRDTDNNFRSCGNVQEFCSAVLSGVNPKKEMGD